MYDGKRTYLEVEFPHIVEEGLDTVIVLGFVQQDELHVLNIIMSTGFYCRSHAHALPGVMKAEMIHSLNLSTDLRYLR
jgi:hypothetical protein